MISTRPSVAALAIAASAAAVIPCQAAAGVPYGGVGQHATVMSNFRQAQRRNDAVIRHVQNNIRSTRPRTY